MSINRIEDDTYWFMGGSFTFKVTDDYQMVDTTSNDVALGHGVDAEYYYRILTPDTFSK